MADEKTPMSTSDESPDADSTKHVSEIKKIEMGDSQGYSEKTIVSSEANKPASDAMADAIKPTLELESAKPSEPEIAKTIEQKAIKPEKQTSVANQTTEMPSKPEPTPMASEGIAPQKEENTAVSSSTMPFNLEKTGLPKWAIFGGAGVLLLCTGCTCLAAIAGVITNLN